MQVRFGLGRSNLLCLLLQNTFAAAEVPTTNLQHSQITRIPTHECLFITSPFTCFSTRCPTWHEIQNSPHTSNIPLAPKCSWSFVKIPISNAYLNYINDFHKLSSSNIPRVSTKLIAPKQDILLIMPVEWWLMILPSDFFSCTAWCLGCLDTSK